MHFVGPGSVSARKLRNVPAERKLRNVPAESQLGQDQRGKQRTDKSGGGGRHRRATNGNPVGEEETLNPNGAMARMGFFFTQNLPYTFKG